MSDDSNKGLVSGDEEIRERVAKKVEKQELRIRSA
jgi:hypothetical protein